MTDEEIEHEADKSWRNRGLWYVCNVNEHSYKDGFKDAAEPREKRIAELEQENAELKEDLRNKKLAIQNRNGRIKELEEENAELKAQIKKMKCCENCKYYKPCVTVNETIGNECEDFYNGCNNSVIVPFGKWEIKEND